MGGWASPEMALLDHPGLARWAFTPYVMALFPPPSDQLGHRHLPPNAGNRAEQPPVELAQFVGGCREVGERACDRLHVVVEHLPVDVVDAVASLVVAAVIHLAGLPAPGLGLLVVFFFASPFSAPPTGMPASTNADSSSPTNSMISGWSPRSWSAGRRAPARSWPNPRGPAVSCIVALAALDEVAAVRRGHHVDVQIQLDLLASSADRPST